LTEFIKKDLFSDENQLSFYEIGFYCHGDGSINPARINFVAGNDKTGCKAGTAHRTCNEVFRFISHMMLLEKIYLSHQEVGLHFLNCILRTMETNVV
jgi:hypothetical protein